MPPVTISTVPQVIVFQYRILCFEIRELNLQAPTRHWENSAAACTVLPSGADLPAHLRSQANWKHEFLGCQNRRDGKHPDTLIKDFRALLDNTQDTMHPVGIYSRMQEFIKHKGRNKTYMSEERLHSMELCVYHGIKVQGEGLEGKRISQMCRCTRRLSWCRGD